MTKGDSDATGPSLPANSMIRNPAKLSRAPNTIEASTPPLSESECVHLPARAAMIADPMTQQSRASLVPEPYKGTLHRNGPPTSNATATLVPHDSNASQDHPRPMAGKHQLKFKARKKKQHPSALFLSKAANETHRNTSSTIDPSHRPPRYRQKLRVKRISEHGRHHNDTEKRQKEDEIPGPGTAAECP